MFHHINNSNILIFDTLNAGVVKLVDTLDLGSSASRHGGSSPSTRTFILFESKFNAKDLLCY